MAYFSKLGTGNIVEKIISVDNSVITDSSGIEQEQLGVDFINNLYGTNDIWKQTSYNTHGGVHKLNGTPFRKNYAGIGYIYDSQKDAFIPPKPYDSWILNENTCNWEAPIAFPTIKTYGAPNEENIYPQYSIFWDETGQRWTGKDSENNEFVWIPSSLSWVSTGN